jgi:hypothetical protein
MTKHNTITKAYAYGAKNSKTLLQDLFDLPQEATPEHFFKQW